MSAYQQQFVLCVINQHGHIVRESNESNQRVARVPFGNEYKLRLINKTAWRAKAEVFIDGTQVHTGFFILNSGETLDLERFMLDGDLSKGKRFKFVESTSSEVQNPYEVKNGRISVKFYRERIPFFGFLENQDWFKSSGGGTGYPGQKWALNSTTYGTIGTSIGVTSESGHTLTSQYSPPIAETNCAGKSGGATLRAAMLSASNVSQQVEVTQTADAGATVEGSSSNQQFVQGSSFLCEATPVELSIQLKGIVPQKLEPVRFRFEPSEIESIEVLNSGNVRIHLKTKTGQMILHNAEVEIA